MPQNVKIVCKPKGKGVVWASLYCATNARKKILEKRR